MVAKVVHCKKEEYDVYIGRPNIWGNPFKVGRDGSRVEVVEKFRDYIATQIDIQQALPSLRGKVLGCWCSPLPCHGDVLLELANES